MTRKKPRGRGPSRPYASLPNKSLQLSQYSVLSNAPQFHSQGFSMQDEARFTAARESPDWAHGDSRLRHRPVEFVNVGVSEPLQMLENTELQGDGEGVAFREKDERISAREHKAPIVASGESTQERRAHNVALVPLTMSHEIGDILSSVPITRNNPKPYMARSNLQRSFDTPAVQESVPDWQSDNATAGKPFATGNALLQFRSPFHFALEEDSVPPDGVVDESTFEDAFEPLKIAALEAPYDVHLTPTNSLDQYRTGTQEETPQFVDGEPRKSWPRVAPSASCCAGTAEDDAGATDVRMLISQDESPLETRTDQKSTSKLGRLSSSASSSSSEEIILFKGREKRRGVNKLHHRQPERRDFDLKDLQSQIELVGKGNLFAAETIQPSSDFKRPGRGRSRRSTTEMTSEDQHDENRMLMDYIANIDTDSAQLTVGRHSQFATRLLGHTDVELVAVSGQSFDNGNIRNVLDKDGRCVKSKIPNTDVQGIVKNLLPRRSNKARSTATANVEVGDDSGSDVGGSTDSSVEQSIDNDLSAEHLGITQAIMNEYGDFDIMDRERPSIRRMGKGSKRQLDIDISDPELAQSVAAAWSSSRLKKAEKKRKREELRTQGRLGRNVDPTDLRIKYPGGITLDQVMDELRAFLLGPHPALSLPPMDNHARKVIHELANKLKLKSKSQGAGNDRRPVLYRSAATIAYSEEGFEVAVMRIRRKYFPRSESSSKKAEGSRTAAKNTATGAARVREGDRVGEGAPHLGVENRGWAMLEKMGWSMGMGLGSGDNKGVLEPVTQVVKISKAGLG